MHVSDPRTLGFDPERLARIDAFLAGDYVAPRRLPHAQILIARDGVPVHFSTQGEARPGEPLRDDSIFRIASMTKPVTSIAYMMLLEDRYPPFGDQEYPAGLVLADEAGPRDRLTVAFRIILAIPHFIVLFFVLFAWWVTAFVAWILILVSGDYPQSLYDFGVGAFRWLIRVEAYVLLLVDEYPPFSLT